MREPLVFRRLRAPVRELTLIATELGLCAVLWPQNQDAVKVSQEPMAFSRTDPILNSAASQIDEYFAGGRKIFDVPLDLRGTDFQTAPWSAQECLSPATTFGQA